MSEHELLEIVTRDPGSLASRSTDHAACVPQRHVPIEASSLVSR